MKVYVVELECDDPYYGSNLIQIFASEEEAEKVAKELTTEWLKYSHREVDVLGA